MESESPPPSPSQQESIDQILQAGWHLLTLINEVLDLAKIESGKLSLSLEPISMSEILSECQTMFESQAQTRNIDMTFCKFDVPCFVHADRTRLKQVIINLLSNAIKYNRPLGKVTVDCITINPKRVRISVKDTGEGLSQEKISQLFQPFNRLGKENSSVEGTGIGLVVAKQLMELMGGEIGVESTVNVGSDFWVELIADSESKLTLDENELHDVVSSHITKNAELHTILYIEDNPANLKLIEQLIARRPDLRLLTAMTGYTGIDLAQNLLPDMILMDINLPDISGIEVLKILRADPATAHIPVVALSANAMPHDIEKGLATGFFRYLTKPININEFMDTLHVTLEFTENSKTARENK
jgi:CheY-like chemotaxis protein